MMNQFNSPGDQLMQNFSNERSSTRSTFGLINKEALIQPVFENSNFDTVLHEYLSIINGELNTLCRLTTNTNFNNLNNFNHLYIVKTVSHSSIGYSRKVYPQIEDTFRFNIDTMELQSDTCVQQIEY
jgi:hypothetical protein